jgi:2-C-methyl-D-erythritol 2,4-cyclodiphosphate synthase
MMKEKGFSVVNLDSTIHLERPKLRSFIDEMRETLAKLFEIDVECISIKAKTGEEVDAVGTSAAIKAEAIILLKSESK